MPGLKIPSVFLTMITAVCLAGCAASPPARVIPSQGFRIDVGAVCSAIDQSPEGRMNQQEFCRYFKNQEGAVEAFEALDTKHKGYVTKDDVLRKQETMDQVIRLTTPSFTR
jgi:hypothetical protein